MSTAAAGNGAGHRSSSAASLPASTASPCARRDGAGATAPRPDSARLFEPKAFAIEPQLSSLGALYPGARAQVLPVVLRNPNPVPILVTSLEVAATADPAGCPSAVNLELTPSSASPAAPLSVPAEGSVTLPTAGVAAPAIGLRDLPVNQDACQGARFPLAFSGEAHG